MSASLYIVAENLPDGLDIHVNGHSLSKSEEQLSQVAKRLEVRERMSFFSQDPDEASDFVEDDTMIPEEQWFTAAEGLATIQALIGHFTSPSSSAEIAVVDELREFERVLLSLKEVDSRWHLAVDF